MLTPLALSILLLAGSAKPGVAVADDGECYIYARSTAQAKIVYKESRGDPTAKNPKSSAFGCGQLLISTRRVYSKFCNGDPHTLDTEEQMCMMSAYIDDRYGSDDRALNWHRRYNWY